MDIKPFTRKEKAIVFFACALGWAHDAIGLTLINFLVLPIAGEFLVTPAHIGFIMSAQYIATVPGAFLFGALADKYGRKNILLISIAWDALLTAASAFAPNYIIFAILRILSGMGVSWGIAFALLGEVYSPKRRAMFGGLVHATFILGYVGSALSAMLLEDPLQAILGTVIWWRPLFLIALIPIPFVLIFYFILPESRLWEKYQEIESPDKMPLGAQLREIVRKGYLKLLVIATLVFWAAEFAYHAFVDWGPTFLQVDLGYTSGQADLTVMIIALILLVVFPVVGLLGDIFGRRRAYMLPAFLGIIGTVVFAFAMLAIIPPSVLIAVGGLFILSMAFSSHGLFGVWSSELFPTSARAAANSVIFSVARGVSLGAWVVGTLWALGIPLYMAMLIGTLGFVLMIILPWLLPETKGKELKPVE